ncbi:hypothetical protein [Endozoicomonas ascidiicola]|uniref:hypothetical protein n=1 Tax=Endozoicomonas ascidiicola TaxID=1698521 RepID=UPI00082958B2|nr:hypothetical protein [Endozoicomonas ascidiicola]
MIPSSSNSNKHHLLNVTINKLKPLSYDGKVKAVTCSSPSLHQFASNLSSPTQNNLTDRRIATHHKSISGLTAARYQSPDNTYANPSTLSLPATPQKPKAKILTLYANQPTFITQPADAISATTNSGNTLKSLKRPLNSNSETESAPQEVAKTEASTITANSVQPVPIVAINQNSPTLPEKAESPATINNHSQAKDCVPCLQKKRIADMIPGNNLDSLTDSTIQDTTTFSEHPRLPSYQTALKVVLKKLDITMVNAELIGQQFAITQPADAISATTNSGNTLKSLKRPLNSNSETESAPQKVAKTEASTITANSVQPAPIVAINQNSPTLPEKAESPATINNHSQAKDCVPCLQKKRIADMIPGNNLDSLTDSTIQDTTTFSEHPRLPSYQTALKVVLKKLDITMANAELIGQQFAYPDRLFIESFQKFLSENVISFRNDNPDLWDDHLLLTQPKLYQWLQDLPEKTHRCDCNPNIASTLDYLTAFYLCETNSGKVVNTTFDWQSLASKKKTEKLPSPDPILPPPFNSGANQYSPEKSWNGFIPRGGVPDLDFIFKIAGLLNIPNQLLQTTCWTPELEEIGISETDWLNTVAFSERCVHRYGSDLFFPLKKDIAINKLRKTYPKLLQWLNQIQTELQLKPNNKALQLVNLWQHYTVAQKFKEVKPVTLKPNLKKFNWKEIFSKASAPDQKASEKAADGNNKKKLTARIEELEEEKAKLEKSNLDLQGQLSRFQRTSEKNTQTDLIMTTYKTSIA